MNDCIFCKIIAGDIPADIIYDDDQTMAFRDINPVAPVHVLVIPKYHYENIADLDKALSGLLIDVACQVAGSEGVAKSGFRLVANSGPDGGQVVPHVHWHVIGGRRLDAAIG